MSTLKLCGPGVKPMSLPDSQIITTPGQGLRVPLLVWIDDRPGNNSYEVSQARLLGIMVIELSSTAIAKAWVEANSGMLFLHDFQGVTDDG